jgi:hypothetical protein
MNRVGMDDRLREDAIVVGTVMGGMGMGGLQRIWRGTVDFDFFSGLPAPQFCISMYNLPVCEID